MPPDNLSKADLRQLSSDLHFFKGTRLYSHFIAHFKALRDSAVEQILDVELKDSTTLYTREAWIGEARSARLATDWFDILEFELQSQLADLQTTEDTP